MYDLHNSNKLLFSIPVHEKQDIINNQLENIFNYNAGCKIILHINKNYTDFDTIESNYPNLFINTNRYKYVHGKGLFWIHAQNFLNAIEQNIDFEYFCIISSNEMFIKNGLINHIEKYKNGLQIVSFDPRSSWHNFHKNIESDEIMNKMITDLGLESFCGGQTEGQFYEKHIFKKIIDIYLQYFGNKEIHSFETEEIIPQTIFKYLNLPYTYPFTLQNYCNDIEFNETVINNIIDNKYIIPNNYIETTLKSPHVNNDSKTIESVFSIKRVDRDFNSIRKYLSKKGFILNGDKDSGKNIYQLLSYYYSNNSLLYLYNEKDLLFKKLKNREYDHNWFGYIIKKGDYYISFKVIISNNHLNSISMNNKIGLKLHIPYELTYSFFRKCRKNNNENEIEFDFNIPVTIESDQLVIFIFDNANISLNIQFKDINISLKKERGYLENKLSCLLPNDFPFNENHLIRNKKKKIIICLYETNNSTYNSDSLNNIYKMIIEPLQNIYDIHIFITVFKQKNEYELNEYINFYYPEYIYYADNISVENIILHNIKKIIEIDNSLYDFVLFFPINSIFKLCISEIDFYFNKINMLSFLTPYIDNKITNNINFLSIPVKYLNIVYKNKANLYLLYDSLPKNMCNIIYKSNYLITDDTPLLLNINMNMNMKGFFLNENYIPYVYYKNKYSRCMKNNNNIFYFSKIKTNNNISFSWLGKSVDNPLLRTQCKVIFDIKLLVPFYKGNSNYGIKTHVPLKYYSDWLDNCIVNEFTHHEVILNINSKEQSILFIFDNYLNDIEFIIKNIKFILF